VSPTTHPHIQQAPAPRVFDLIAQLVVLCGGEREAVPVTPHQGANIEAASGGIAEYLAGL
jgi:hypothetical protein